jgi:hypothetical protein
VYPPILIGDAAARLVVFIIEIRRQDHCLCLRLWLAASHAASVAGVSSATPGVADGTEDEQATSSV